MAATAPGASVAYQKCMAEAIKRFSRSIELCDDYLRGYYGLKLVSWPTRPRRMPPWLTLAQVTSKLLKESAKPSKPSEEGEFALPDTTTLEKLNELASAKLSEIVRRSTAREAGWRGYDELEVAAARELLSEETSAHSARER